MNTYITPTTCQNEITEKKDVIRILRRLCEKNAFLVMALSLPKAVVMRGTGKSQVRSAVLSRELGQSLLIKGWIERTGGGKLNRYEVTSAGRASLKRMIYEQLETQKATGFAEAPNAFQEQHREWGERYVTSEGDARSQKIKVNLRESPINMLGRKKR